MAKQEFERALALSPGYAMGRCWYANFYLNWACGDFEHGVAEARRALDSDPLSAYVTMTLGVSLFTAGHLDEAIDTCRRAIQLDPESFVSRWALGIALGMAGRSAEAVSALDAAAVTSGRHPLALSGLAGVYGQAGQPPKALARRAWDEREPSFILWARHSDPRFAAILREMDSSDEHETKPNVRLY
jgi:tetratricopeptide (TPR) repeat protein